MLWVLKKSFISGTVFKGCFRLRIDMVASDGGKLVHIIFSRGFFDFMSAT